jgi:hypothetical protein
MDQRARTLTPPDPSAPEPLVINRDPLVLSDTAPSIDPLLTPAPLDVALRSAAPASLSEEALPETDRASAKTRVSKIQAKPARLDRASAVLLALLVVGLLAFVAGIALASAILTGVLDLQTGWVKDLLHSAKDFVRQLNAR